MTQSQRNAGLRRPVGGLALVALIALIVLEALVGDAAAQRQVAEPGHVGSEACRKCHATEYERWRGSHHDLAMQPATPRTVLGDFSGKSAFEHAGTKTTFARRGDRFVVRTDGPDGKLQDYDVKYTFGVDPLQQYLVELPGGRLQALGVAWDSRPRTAGGQRWMHLYPNERVTHTDPLHWTKPSQNWNQRCAVCHSTALEKHYDPAKDAYATTWAEISVGCEACHGPGAAHVSWARERAQGRDGADATKGGTKDATKDSAKDSAKDTTRAAITDATKGLAVRFRDGPPARWLFPEGGAIARRERPRESHVEIETCAPCHARRSALVDGAPPGRLLMDAHRPALLTEALYHADGQILDEVYEYGSFLQSRMYAAGVTCSDCHDPHSLALRAPGDAVCAGCHLPTKFDTPDHTLHPKGSPGASCIACHMPSRTYMVVDERHDHGFRVPRPDLTARLGTPNACAACHADRSPEWATAALEKRNGPATRRSAAVAEAISAGRKGSIDAEGRLIRLADDRGQPAIARATALALLEPPTPEALRALERGAADPDPLVRMAAADGAQSLPPPLRAAVAARLLADPVLAVRLAAANALVDAPRDGLDQGQRRALDAALDEYRAAQMASADAPEANLSLGVLALLRGDPESAERFYRTAVRVAPYFIPTYLNLADLRRAQGRDDDGEEWLRKAIAIAPDHAGAHHALGLLLVRRGKRDEALVELRRAVELDPNDARFAYVLGIALHSTGDTSAALAALRAGNERRPADRDLLFALATVSRDAGDLPGARTWAARLVAVDPTNEQAKRLSQDLESRR